MASTQLSPEQLRENRGPSIIAYNSVMIVIPTAAVAFRFWSRSLTRSEKYGHYWWDDWMVLAALPWCIATNSLAIRLVQLGLGRHIAAIAPENLAEALKVLFATYIVYDTALTLAKSSALLFYARIFETHSKWFTRALWATQAIVWAWWLGIVFGTIFMCNPVSKNWIPTEEGYCGSTGDLWVGSAVPSVFIDLVILLLPLPMIWKLHLPTIRKLMVCGIFVCGYAVIVISIGRLVTVTTGEEALNADLTWNGVDALFWLAAETPVTILSICLPSLFFLWRHARQYGAASLFSSRLSSERARLREQYDGPSGFASRKIKTKNKNSITNVDDIELQKHSVSDSAASGNQADLNDQFAPSGASVNITAGGNHTIVVPKSGIAVSNDFEVSRS